MTGHRVRAMARTATIEAILRHDRGVVLAGLAGVTALAWVYLFLAAGPADMSGIVAGVRPWAVLDVALMLLMWAVMMVGMIVPGAAPMILLFAAVRRRQGEKGRTLAPTGAFLSGYIAVWTGFSLAATALQWALDQAALLSPMMVGTSPVLGGVVLIGAGVYQWTPLKNACLDHCRSPIHFLSRSWRPGTLGAFVMGLEHGAFCVGCCWVLMALLFVGGVMNLLWVAAIAMFVLIEKAAPFGVAMGRLGAAVLILAGASVILAG